jgi:hypothetical protein
MLTRASSCRAFLLKLGQTLVGAAEQIEALDRGGAPAQGVEVENGRFDTGHAIEPDILTLGFRQVPGFLPAFGGETDAEVGVLLQGAHRALAFFGGEGFAQPFDGFFPIADFAPGQPERGADVGPLAAICRPGFVECGRCGG